MHWKEKTLEIKIQNVNAKKNPNEGNLAYRKVQVDVGFIFEPKLVESVDDFHILLRMRVTIHGNSHEEFLSWSWNFVIHNPHF